MITEFNAFLTLDLQFFAEDLPEPEESIESPTEEPKFTQADIDRIVADRLAREQKKAQKAIDDAKAEAERKKLEESSEYKSLYEQTKAKLEEIETQAKLAQLTSKKQTLLLSAGYTAEQIAEISELVIGEDEDAIVESVERIKKLIPVKPIYADPQVGGTQRQTPKTKDEAEIGREMYQRIKGKLRR